eukprot:GHVU01042633.1.p2 GENE.GHVU01042633.1~~GHVU01042633.1.p2  ORF type:complete len:131 (-),score=13.43 GHVU01042633.1:771-1163(-)
MSVNDECFCWSLIIHCLPSLDSYSSSSPSSRFAHRIRLHSNGYFLTVAVSLNRRQQGLFQNVFPSFVLLRLVKSLFIPPAEVREADVAINIDDCVKPCGHPAIFELPLADIDDIAKQPSRAGAPPKRCRD